MSDLIGAASPSSLIFDCTIETFEDDVLKASMEAPVIVDFWATWCGPCKTLTPILEKAVTAANGAVRLAKIDIDKNQVLASQLRIQSVPTVYAFFQGRPIDGFQGALPESEVKAFIDRVMAAAGGGSPEQQIEEIIAMAEAALKDGQIAEAAQAFASVAQATAEQETGPDLRAVAGLINCHLAMGEADKAQQIFDSLSPEQQGDQVLSSIKATLSLADAAVDDGALGSLKATVSSYPDDHQARFELAEAEIGAGRMEDGVANLLTILEADLQWNDEEARKKLLTVFEALGPTDPITLKGRRRLSSLLFS
ncbi:MAG: co-chaperone YbbN [Pseudomonadota bacterium]